MQCERGEKGTHSPALGGGGLRGAGLGVGGRASCGALPLAVPLRSRSPTLPAPWPTARRGSAAGRCRPGRRRPPRALGRPQRRPTRAAALCVCVWGGGGERGGGGGKGGEDEKRDELIKSGAAEVFFFFWSALDRVAEGGEDARWARSNPPAPPRHPPPQRRGDAQRGGPGERRPAPGRAPAVGEGRGASPQEHSKVRLEGGRPGGAEKIRTGPAAAGAGAAAPDRLDPPTMGR